MLSGRYAQLIENIVVMELQGSFFRAGQGQDLLCRLTFHIPIENLPFGFGEFPNAAQEVFVIIGVDLILAGIGQTVKFFLGFRQFFLRPDVFGLRRVVYLLGMIVLALQDLLFLLHRLLFTGDSVQGLLMLAILLREENKQVVDLRHRGLHRRAVLRFDLLQTVQKCIVKNTSAKAAVDIALWDLYGQLYGIPVYKLMGGARKHIVTDITISVNDPEEMARDAVSAVERGYDCLKVKVGADPTLDVARLAAVRQAVGNDVCIRIDANQAWQPKEAVRILNQMQERGLALEFVEQPVKAHDLAGMKYVTERSYVPVLADESVFSPEDALKIMQMGAADMVNIKLMKCGGLYNALKIVSAAEVYGVECMIGCMLEAKISVNAAVELACAKKIITRIDLDGPVLCSEDPIIGGAVFNEKNITVSDGPGLGIKGVEPGRLVYL